MSKNTTSESWAVWSVAAALSVWSDSVNVYLLFQNTVSASAHTHTHRQVTNFFTRKWLRMSDWKCHTVHLSHLKSLCKNLMCLLSPLSPKPCESDGSSREWARRKRRHGGNSWSRTKSKGRGLRTWYIGKVKSPTQFGPCLVPVQAGFAAGCTFPWLDVSGE